MRNSIITMIVCLFCVSLVAQVSQKEKQALLDFYLATNGENWINTWDVNTPVSDWQGVTVENNTVTSISILFNNIEGTLPNSMGDLENLKVLELSFNKISGTLPASLGNLKNLEVFAFNGNNLIGSIPVTLGNLTNLKQLHLSSNKLTGGIPKSIARIKSLEVFNVFDNDLMGTIPTEFSKSRNLRELLVAENRLKNNETISVVLLSNSGNAIDLNRTVLSPSAKTVIAIETSDDDH